MRTKRLYRILSLICLCVMFIGCGFSDKKTKNNEEKSEYDMVKEMISRPVELNDRQKEILESEGLPTDYNSLKDKQKESIIKIEMLLEYLEDKYGEEFEYVEFYRDDGGMLIARAVDDGKCRDFQSGLNWNPTKGEYTYVDQYDKVVASDKYEELLKQYMAENHPEVEFFDNIHVEEFDGSEKEVSNRNASASVTIIMKDCYDDKEKYKELGQDIGGWMNNDKFGNVLFLIVMDEAVYPEANYYSYTRLIQEDKSKYRFVFDIRDGKIDFSEREN